MMRLFFWSWKVHKQSSHSVGGTILSTFTSSCHHPSFLPWVQLQRWTEWEYFKIEKVLKNTGKLPWRKWCLHPQQYSSCPAGDILQLLWLLLQSRAPMYKKLGIWISNISVSKERAAQSIFWSPTLKAANFMTSAMMKPFSKSVWIRPAAWDQVNINAEQEKRKTRIYLGCGASFLDRPCFHLEEHTF